MREALWARRPRVRQGESAQPVLDGEPTTLAEVRALRLRLRAGLDDRGLPPGATADDLERLLLVFEELVSNGLRHGGAPVQVLVVESGTGWLVEVGDATGDVPPVPAVGRDAALGGLGLYPVAQLSAAHGGTAGGDGRTVVWARVDATAAPGPDAADDLPAAPGATWEPDPTAREAGTAPVQLPGSPRRPGGPVPHPPAGAAGPGGCRAG